MSIIGEMSKKANQSRKKGYQQDIRDCHVGSTHVDDVELKRQLMCVAYLMRRFCMCHMWQVKVKLAVAALEK